jgi:hypothetical protein
VGDHSEYPSECGDQPPYLEKRHSTKETARLADYNGAMLALLLHGGWDTLIAAAVFWLSPFIVLFLIVRWAIPRPNRRTHPGSQVSQAGIIR